MRYLGVCLAIFWLAACNVGVDPTPPGCDLLKVKAASYQPHGNRVYIRLSNGSLFWAHSTGIYESWNDKHIGEFEKGSDVIVCPPKRGERTWLIRNNIVGETGNDFHRLQPSLEHGRGE